MELNCASCFVEMEASLPGKAVSNTCNFHLFCQPNTNVLCLHTDNSPSSLLPVLSLIIDWPVAILGS